MPKGQKEIEKKAVALQTLSIEYVDIGAVAPNDYNPNRQSDHDFELLQRSMKEDGFTQPIIVLRKTNPDGRHLIVDGEHRWRAARALGISSIPVAMVDMTEEQAKIATLRHNRARGSEDLELSAAVLRDLQQLGALDWAADSLMLSDSEIDKLLSDIPAPEAMAAEQFTEAWEPSPFTQDTSRELPMNEGGVSRTSATAEASDRVRDMERRIEAAKTAEERAAITRDTDIFRLILMFSGQEAVVMRRVAGDNPAANLLRVCRAEVARMDAEAGEPPAS